MHRGGRGSKEVLEQAPAGLDMSGILELIDKNLLRPFFGFEVSGKHLPPQSLIELRVKLNPPDHPPAELPGLQLTVVRRGDYLKPVLGQPCHVIAVRVNRSQGVDAGKQRIGNQGIPLETKLRDCRTPARAVTNQCARDHLVSVTDAEYNPILVDRSSNQGDQRIKCGCDDVCVRFTSTVETTRTFPVSILK
jgi:hypothetical protein